MLLQLVDIRERLLYSLDYFFNSRNLRFYLFFQEDFVFDYANPTTEILWTAVAKNAICVFAGLQPRNSVYHNEMYIITATQ